MKSSSWLPVSLCLLCQCAGTETGNPFGKDDVRVAFAPLQAAVPRPGLGEVRFESVAIRVASLTLESCDGGEPAVLFQDRSVDLFAGELGGTQVPTGRYCAWVVGMGSGADSFAAGRMISNGRTTLTFDSQLRAEVRLELLEPLLTSDAQTSWILGVDLPEWLDAIDAWLNSSDSQLLLSSPQTAALRQAQARSLHLYADSDQDGRLDTDELEAPLTKPGVLQP